MATWWQLSNSYQDRRQHRRQPRQPNATYLRVYSEALEPLAIDQSSSQ